MHPKHPKPPKPTVHKAPLSQSRYEGLLRDMSRLFTEAEKPSTKDQAKAQRLARLAQQREQEAAQQALLQHKQQAIEEILVVMAKHGLTTKDLV